MSRRHLVRLSSALVAAACCALLSPGAVAAQARPWYVTPSPSSFPNHVAPIRVIQGGTVVRDIPTVGSAEYALAVAGDIRTVGAWPGTLGSRYALDGTPLGTPYDVAPTGFFYDGTTDGTQYNYTVDSASPHGTVYRANRDWTGLTPLFTPAGGGTRLGITYDTGTNTLWLATWRAYDPAISDANNWLEQYSLSGNLLSSFRLTGHWGPIEVPGALAYDGVDQTLWLMGNWGGGGGGLGYGRLYQFSRGGALLHHAQLPVEHRMHYMGGEFEVVRDAATVPEPTSLALVLGGGLALAAAARRRRGSRR